MLRKVITFLSSVGANENNHSDESIGIPHKFINTKPSLEEAQFNSPAQCAGLA